VKRKLLAQGFRLNLEDETYETTMSGVFEGNDDQYDANRHRVRTAININTGLNTVYANVAYNKVTETVDRSTPLPDKYVDITSDTTDDQLTPGGIGQVTGHRLKIDTTDPDEGVFFVGLADEYQVDKLVRNKPAELIFQIPTGMPAGNYTLEVRTHFQGSKTLRVGIFKVQLSVLPVGP